MKKSYIPLHIHSHFSIGDSILSVEEYLNWAKENQIDSISITDHGNLCGGFGFNQACWNTNIKPIIGVEAYCCFKDEFELIKEKKVSRQHLILLAKNKQGYFDLLGLIGKSMRESYYYRPIIFYEDIFEKSKNLICLSACTAGRIPNLIINEKYEELEKFISLMKKNFNDDFYLECVLNELEEQKKTTEWIMNNYERLGVKPVVTTDSHYLKPEHNIVHDVHCVNTRKQTFNDKGVHLYTCRNLSLKTYDQIVEESKVLKYDENFIRMSLDNTSEVSNKVEKYNLVSEEVIMPRFGNNSFEVLKEKAYIGLKKINKHENQIYIDRLEKELHVINAKNMSDYFLIIDEIVEFSKNNDVFLGIGRGSAAGSLLSYCLNITKLDPMKYGLLFERFLSEVRKDPPDIDIDFDSKNRYKIEEYLKNKYGEDCVSHIISFGRYGIKGSIRDSFRAFHGTLFNHILEDFMKVIDDSEEDFDNAIKIVLSKYPTLESFYKEHKQKFDIAKVLLNKNRHLSLHASGVVITPNKLEKFIPIIKIKDQIAAGLQEGADIRTITEAGLMKFDLLGLNACCIIKDCLKFLGNKITIQDIINDNNNEKVYKEFRNGNSFGIFQFEGRNITNFTKLVKPNKFEDLIAINALYRPAVIQAGGLQNFLKSRDNFDMNTTDMVKKELKDTYGTLCLMKGSNIFLNNMIKKIEDIKSGEKICSFKDNKIYIAEVDTLIKSGKKQTFQICLSSGIEVYSSKDHRFLTLSGDKFVNELKYKKMSRYNKLWSNTDKFFECWKKSNNEINIGNKQSYYLGLYLADGGFRDQGICTGSKEAAEFITNFTVSIFGGFPRIRKHTRAWYSSVSFENGNRRTPISKFFDSLYGFDCWRRLRSHNKYLPDNFINYTYNNRVNLLKGLWDGDGNYTVYYYRSISNILLKNICDLLSSLKISFHINGNYVYIEDKIAFQKIVGKPLIPGKIYSDKFFPTAVNINYMKDYLLKHNVKYIKRKFLYTKKLENKLYKPYALSRVFKDKEIESAYWYSYDLTYQQDVRPVSIIDVKKHLIEECYDIQMKDQSNPYFVVEGVVSHNCYQEQVLVLFNKLAGFTLEEADDARHALKLLFKGKTDYSEFNAIMDHFKKGCHENTNYNDQEILDIMEMIKQFSSYSFNKSHSACYAMNGYVMMYLKVFHPNEFFCALLSNTDNAESVQEKQKVNMLMNYMQRIYEEGKVKLLKPDINFSEGSKFKIVNDGIMYPLNKIKNVGEKAVEEILRTRPFISFEDFLSKVTLRKVNKKVVKALICSGAINFEGVKEKYEKKYDDLINIEDTITIFEQLESNTVKKSKIEEFKQKYSSTKFEDLGTVKELVTGNYILCGYTKDIIPSVTKTGKMYNKILITDFSSEVLIFHWPWKCDSVLEKNNFYAFKIERNGQGFISLIKTIKL